MTTSQFENRVGSYLEEYLGSGDLKELIECLGEMVPKLPEGKQQSDLGMLFVEQGVMKGTEARSDDPRDKLALAFGPLAKNGFLAGAALQQFFTDGLEFLEDEVVDIPFIAIYYSKWLAHAALAGLLPLGFVNKALAPLIDAQLVKPAQAVGGQSGAAFMVVSMLQCLSKLEDAEALKARYAGGEGADKLDLLVLMPEADRKPDAVGALLETAEIAFVDPSLIQAAKKAVAAASEQQIKEQQAALDEALTTRLGPAEGEGDTNEQLIEWIGTSCTGLEDAAIARTVMRCVLETATAEEPPSPAKITKQIERRKVLLLKYNASGAEAAVLHAQAACLYEVQAFCGRKGWPAGLIKKVFYNLYETDIVFEDAYTVWKEDVSDETPGKDRALFQVNEFLQWLAEAAEEDDGNDDE